MSNIDLVIDADNKLANLPSPDVIIQQCLHAHAQPKRRPSPRDHALCAWVKFGHSITMSEARKQHFFT